MATVTTKPSPSAAPGGGSPGGHAGAIGDGRADQIGEALENVDAHGAVAADAKAGGAIEARLAHRRRRRRRCGRRRRDAGPRRCPSRFRSAMLQRPELRGEGARRRLEQAPADKGDRRRSARRICAAPRGRPAAGSSFRRRRGSARAHRATSAIWKAMPRAMPSRPSPISSSTSGPSSFLTCWASQRSSRFCTMFERAPVSCSSASSGTRGFRICSPAAILPTGSPSQRMIPSLARTKASSTASLTRARGLDLARQGLLRGGVQSPGGFAFGLRIGREAKSVEVPDVLTLDHDVAARR